MKKHDARKQGSAVQQEKRRQIIRLRRQGRQNGEVAKIVGVSVGHASRTWQKYLNGGHKAIILGQRGRRHGAQRVLIGEQEDEIQRLIVERTPDQLKLPFALWTRRAVQVLIKERYGLRLPVRTVGEYLNRWGFTPQKPIKRAYEQQPRAVKRWLDQEYPSIAARAKREKAEIYWGDETGIQTNASRERGYAPIGKTPVIRLSAKHTNISMISAITNQGKVRFLMYQNALTSERLIAFMERLIRESGSKVFLILDNLRVHHSKTVKQWVQAHRSEIEVFHLPSYAPEYNPDECLNSHLKTSVHSGCPARTKDELVAKTGRFMLRLRRQPQVVRNYFRHPKICYAA
jgi:transposase